MKYGLEEVGTNAGKIWTALNAGEKTLTEIVDVTEVKKDEVLVALGWLLREGKVDVKEEKKKEKFFLI